MSADAKDAKAYPLALRHVLP
eukprot:COSAG02_NODE_58176_length_278_cov_0.631285_1_plen_20_part_01